MLDNFLVREWMTAPVLTVALHTPISTVHQLMKDNNIRRLPVVENDKLVGIITLGDVREASPSQATALSIWELNYLWAQLTVEKVMSSPVLTVKPDDLLIDAASLMLDHKIGGLPVVSGDGRLVGILTESDIFRMVVQSRSKALVPTP